MLLRVNSVILAENMTSSNDVYLMLHSFTITRNDEVLSHQTPYAYGDELLIILPETGARINNFASHM